MAKVYEGTNQGTGKIRIQKNVGEILIVTEYCPNFENIRFLAHIERPQGNNVEITQDVKLLPYAVMCKLSPIVNTFTSQSNIVDDKHVITLHIGNDAGLLLTGGDTLVLEVYGLSASKKTTIYNLDDTEHKREFRKHEVKNVLSDEMSKVFQTNGSEFCYIDSTNVRLVVLKTTKGNRLEYTPDELRQMVREVYPSFGQQMVSIGVDNALALDSALSGLLVPTFDAVEFEIFKNTSGVVPVHFQYDAGFTVPLRTSGGNTLGAQMINSLRK